MKIGFLGTGLMGEPMAQRLLSAQIPVIAYNRTQSKLASLREAGAQIAKSPAEVMEAADCLILMLTDAKAIKEVLFSENGAAKLAKQTVIQMGTISPGESRELHQLILSSQGDYLEAPVLGSIPEAQKGELLVMVGAEASQFQQWHELLQKFGSQPILIGKVGTAAALKLALNQLIGSLTTAFALSLNFLQKEGVEVDKFMEILCQSALYAPTFDKKLSRMSNRNYANPNFPTKHLLKDVNLFLNQAREDNLNISSLEGVREVIEKAINLGFAEEDYSAIFSAIDSP
jgi:3-hydroxyisobutyrate dehydrogenase